ncbi:MAG: ABC transporter ATPase [Bacteroidia bacterium]
MFVNFNDLPGHSRVWVYQADRILSEDEELQISVLAKQFVERWTAHNQDLQASFQIRYNLFLILAADETQASASGCSIDKSVAFIKELQQKFNVNFLNRMIFAYKEHDEVYPLKREEFAEKIKTGYIDNNTIVFNNLVLNKSDLNTSWEIPYAESWHKHILN